MKTLLLGLLFSYSAFASNINVVDGRYKCFNLFTTDLIYDITSSKDKLDIIGSSVYTEMFKNKKFEFIDGKYPHYELVRGRKSIELRNIRMKINKFGIVMSLWRTVDTRLSGFDDHKELICINEGS